MINSPILSSMLWFSLPIILSNVLQLLFNAADIVIVGRYAGDVCLAAVSSTTSIINLIVNVFIGLAIGVNVLVARQIGEERFNAISETIHTSIGFAFVCGVVSTIVGLLTARPALQAMDCPAEVIDLAVLYLRIYYLGMPAMLVYNCGASVLRAKGDTKRPLYFLLFSGLVNVILNIVLVTVFGMNVDGVAIATVVSQLVSAFLTMFLLVKEEETFRFYFNKIKIKAEPLKEILRIGLPASFQNSMFSISNVVLQSNINALGTAAIAGSGASASVVGFANGIINGIMSAVTTYVSQNYGAGRVDRIKKTVAISCFIGFVWCVIFFLVAFFFGEELLYFYTDEPAVVEMGLIKSKVIIYSYYTYALMQIAVGALRGMGYATSPAIISLVGVCGVRLLLIWFVFEKVNMFNIALTYPISWLTTAIVVWVLLIIVIKNNEPKKA